MAEYRRNRVEGGTYFFVVCTHDRQPFLTTPAAREILHEAYEFVRAKHPFTTEAICLMPDHLHAIWTLPEGDDDYSLRWKEIKRRFSHRYKHVMTAMKPPNRSRQSKGELTIWQRRFWEHTIRDEMDYENHFNYLHFNPVKHGKVVRPADWEWSSFARYVKAGVYDPDWGDQRTLPPYIDIPAEFE